MTTIGINAFLGCTNVTDVYCFADPSKLEWSEDLCNDFKAEKATKCHVFNTYTFNSKWNTGNSSTDVNVTFVTDLTSSVSTNQISSGDFTGYWATYYNSLGNMQAPEGVTVYKAVKDGSSLTLTEIEDRIIVAGKGVVLKAASDDITLTATETTPAGDYDGNSLTGVNVQTTISGSTYDGKYIYTLAKEGDALGFYHYNGTNLGANKAFLATEIAVTAGARGFVFQFEESTGIESLTPTNSNGEGSGYYNLSGQRVSKPTKGLYIVNGKKIFVK